MRLSIPKADQEIIRQLVHLDDEAVTGIIDALEGMKAALNADAVDKALVAVTDLEGLASVLLQLCRLKQEDEIPWGKVLDDVAASVADWQKRDWTQWAKRRERVQDVLSVGPLNLAAKAIDLAAEHGNILYRARVVSDVRPVFDDDGIKVDAAVVVHTLRLEYTGDARKRSIGISLDQDDLFKLKRQCERAIEKAERIKATVASGWGAPVVIAGEEYDGAE